MPQELVPGAAANDWVRIEGLSKRYGTVPALSDVQFSIRPGEILGLIGPNPEKEIMKGLFAGADYVHQHWSNLDRTVDLNAPAPFDRTAIGQVRTVQAANATRPIVPVNGGVRSVNVLMNLGVADYDGLQTLVSYRGRMYASLSYTLAKATNTTEPDGNGINPNDANITRLGEEERGPSVVDQRHRAVVTFSYNLPYNITAGTLAQFASARPFNATTGIDNNGDRANNDRPVIDGKVIAKSAFRGTPTSEVALFAEGRIKHGGQPRPLASCRSVQFLQPWQHSWPGADGLW